MGQGKIIDSGQLERMLLKAAGLALLIRLLYDMQPLRAVEHIHDDAPVRCALHIEETGRQWISEPVVIGDMGQTGLEVCSLQINLEKAVIMVDIDKPT